MAEQEQTIILNVETQGAKTLKELREQIKELKKQRDEYQVGSAKYKETITELTNSEKLLKNAMNSSTESYEDLDKAAKGLGTSYNALVNRMAQLKKAWRATEDAAKRAELGREIADINQELKDLDAETGNFQRNVGDYRNKMVEAFQATAGSAAGVINPLQNMGVQFKALSATPLIAILGLLAKAIEVIIKGLKSSEATMNSVTESFSIFGAASTALTNIIQKLGKHIAKLGQWLGKTLDKMGLVTEEMKVQQQLAKDEIAITQKQREVQMKNADDMLAVSQLKAKATEKLKYTDQERLQYLEEANAKEEDIARRNMELAKMQYDLLVEKSKLADNSKEENDELAASYANMIAQEQAYYDKVRELNSQIVEATNAMNAKFKEQIGSAMAAQDEFIQSEVAALEQEEIITESYEDIFGDVIAENTDMYAELKELRWEDVKDTEAGQKAKEQLLMASAGATASIMGSIASIIESSGKNSEKAAKAAKGLRIAESTINTITGAIKAYMSVAEIPFIGPALGAINAAVVTAAGVANIVKIKNTPIPSGTSGSGVSSSTPSFSKPTISAPTPQIPDVRAPKIPDSINRTANLTGLDEEERLNRAQRVFIVSSDIEENGRRVAVRDAETSF